MNRIENLKKKIILLNNIINDNKIKIETLSSIDYNQNSKELNLEITHLEEGLNYEYKYNYDIKIKYLILNKMKEIEKENKIFENEKERFLLKNKDLKEQFENKKNVSLEEINDIKKVNKNLSSKLNEIILKKNNMIKNNYEDRKNYLQYIHNNKQDKKNKEKEIKKYDNILEKLYNNNDMLEEKINIFVNKKKESNELYYDIKKKIDLFKNKIQEIDNKIQYNIIHNLDIDYFINNKDKYIDKLDKLLLNPNNNIIEIYNEYDKEIYKVNKEIQDLSNHIVKIKILINYKKNNNIKSPMLHMNKNTKLINIKRDICNYRTLINNNLELIININNKIDDLNIFYIDCFDTELKYRENSIKRIEISDIRIKKKYQKLIIKIKEQYKLEEEIFEKTKKKLSSLKTKINNTKNEMNIKKKSNEQEIIKFKKENSLKEKEIINIKIQIENLK